MAIRMTHRHVHQRLPSKIVASTFNRLKMRKTKTMDTPWSTSLMHVSCAIIVWLTRSFRIWRCPMCAQWSLLIAWSCCANRYNRWPCIKWNWKLSCFKWKRNSNRRNGSWSNLAKCSRKSWRRYTIVIIMIRMYHVDSMHGLLIVTCLLIWFTALQASRWRWIFPKNGGPSIRFNAARSQPPCRRSEQC